MKNRITNNPLAARFLAIVLPTVLAMLLTGCAMRTARTMPSTMYDLGQPTSSSTTTLPTIAITVADTVPTAWLDSPLMFYRLLYENAQQPRPYAQSRWATQPAQLFTQRLKARIAQAGGIAASAADGPTNLSLLRIEADDFSQAFDSPIKSYGHIAVRASVYQGRTLIAQKSFAASSPAPSNDAEGGVRALSLASDAVIHDMVTWLATLPLKR